MKKHIIRKTGISLCGIKELKDQVDGPPTCKRCIAINQKQKHECLSYDVSQCKYEIYIENDDHEYVLNLATDWLIIAIWRVVKLRKNNLRLHFSIDQKY